MVHDYILTHTKSGLDLHLGMESARISEVLSAISDDVSLELLKSIALAEANSSALRARLQVTRRQYYFRLFKLVQFGLVRRINGVYSLTPLGKVLFDAQASIERAMSGNLTKNAVGA